MSPERDQELGLDTHISSPPEQPVSSSKRFLFRLSSAAPPPYTTSPSTPNVSGDPSLSPHFYDPQLLIRPPTLPEVSSRRLPTPPISRYVFPIEETTAGPSQLGSPSHVAGILPSESLPQSSATTSFAFSPVTSSLSPQPDVNSPSQSQFLSAPPGAHITKSLSIFKLLKRPRPIRNATAQIAEQAAWRASEDARHEAELARRRAVEVEAARRTSEQAARERDEEVARHIATQANAKEAVQSCIRSLLVCSHPSDEDPITVLSRCAQICHDGGLELSAVLQEPLIEEQTPVYWAILNRHGTSSEIDNAATDNALVVALLNACGSLNETTIVSVRLACMLVANNVLLQNLFRKFPGLSPRSMRDGILLGPLGLPGGGDVVDVEEKRDGTGAFIAHIKIWRFRLRMGVSKAVKVEFVTFGRIWMATFYVSTEHAPERPSGTKWLFSLELVDNSTPTWVDADLLVSGRSRRDNNPEINEPIYSIPIGSGGHALQAGRENAIKVRLDDGPMRLHWINESLTLVDADGTLHAELNVRLTQPLPPATPLSPLASDNSDAWSQVSSFMGTQGSTSNSEHSRSTTGKKKDRRTTKDPNQQVFTSLRRGGR